MDQAGMSLLMIVVMFAAMYFFMIRPQRKRDKEVKSMRDSLAAGDEVITIGGIHGKVVKVNDEIVVVELDNQKQRMTFSKWAVGSVSKKGKETKKSNDDAKANEELPENAEDDKKEE